ncbi:Aldo/keto reductase [Zopfochytrium polystomum]|nr:Aldo/keto reductase [Zopfochytrium polystomum]
MASATATVELGTLPAANRLLIGMWQLSSPAWGSAPKAEILASLKRHYDAGYRTFDMADHYGNAELIFAEFQRALPIGSSAPLGFTKWCPSPGPMSRSIVEAAMRERISRMKTTSIDLIQFHWWEYSDRRYMDAMKAMDSLRKEGLIKNIGLTNFDTKRVKEFVDAGIPIVSNQVQYSLIDRRPEVKMAALCTEHNIKLLTYGTLCGGLLTDGFLNAPEPSAPSLTPSQRKYMSMIRIFGGWAVFQALLRTLRGVADRHNRGNPSGKRIDIAHVAMRYILEKPFVAGVIVGARLGVREHVDENLAVWGWKLEKQDLDEIEEMLDTSNGSKMFEIVGDCGDEYRR